MNEEEIRVIVRAAVEEYAGGERTRQEDSVQAELSQERQLRETLQKQVESLVGEGVQLKSAADEAQRTLAIRTELQRLGIRNVDLAYRAVRDDVRRSEDGKYVGASGQELAEYLRKFASENPELLPARVAGGSGAQPGQRVVGVHGPADIDKIRPGMNPEELERMRQEIARVASQTMRGL